MSASDNSFKEWRRTQDAGEGEPLRSYWRAKDPDEMEEGETFTAWLAVRLEQERDNEVLNEIEGRLEERKIREMEAKEEQERERHAQKQAQEKAARKEQKRRAWLEREREMDEKLRLMEEKLECEMRERIEGERKRNMKIKSLTHTIDCGVRLVNDLLLHQPSSCACGIHPCRCNHSLRQQERVELLEGGSDDDLLNIFGESNTLLQGPKNGQGTTLLELDYQVLDDFEDDDIVSSATTNATKAKEKGNAYFKEQKFEEAIKWYSKSIDELPTTVAYCNRAMAYLVLNKFIEVEKDCTEALRIDDRYFKAYARRATARTRLGSNLEGALVDVQVALELESNNKEILELYAELMSLKAATEAKEEGNAHFKDGNFQGAIICYSVSINKTPTVVAYSNRAMAYLKLYKFMEAENDCTKALKIDDHYFKAYARRAIARSKLGRNRREGALKDIELALKLEPDNQEMKELHVELNQVFK